MKCKYCEEDMEKDDIDYSFKGCYDVSWICQFCKLNLVQKFRFSQLFEEILYDDDGDVVEKKKYKIKVENKK